jgi:ureidoglycolate lyase
MPSTLTLEPLNAKAFEPFGEVIEPRAANAIGINDGTAVRHDRLARVQTDSDGEAAISLFVGQPRALPFPIRTMERHPLGSQAFMPLDHRAYLVVVARDNGDSYPQPPQAFLASPEQGVSFHAGCWHHPLLTLDQESRFLVVDRVGPGENCQTAQYDQDYLIYAAVVASETDR